MLIYLLVMTIYAIYLLVRNHKTQKSMIELGKEKNIILSTMFTYFWTDAYN